MSAEPPAAFDARTSYERSVLDEASLERDPIAQFRRWFDEAVAAQVREPHGMTVATVGEDGRPSARIVLLRGLDERGFVFFTNYESRKGRELGANENAALLFWWPEVEREVRIEGTVARLDAPESDAYFARRPRGHRLSAWASPQSRPVADRAELERRMHDAEVRFPGDDVPRPGHWGGFRVRPRNVEFWQGRRDRVHDRLLYERSETTWTVRRLAP